MRKAFLIALGILAWAGIGLATITLNTSQIQTFQVGGSTVENDTIASATSATMDFGPKIVRITVDVGSTNSGSFVSGQHGKSLLVTIDSVNGTVAVSDGRANLKLTAAQQTAIKNTLTNFQNNIETALINWGIVSGTQVAN